MPTYEVYLEITPEGICIAHVPDLPGCMARGATQAAALAALPDTIRGYHIWLRAHGEAVPTSDPIEVHVAETQTGLGPVMPDDQAALFAPDRQPVSIGDIDRYLRYADYNRTDLLALTRGLSKTALDWRATPGDMSIRQILQHIGTGERFYLSRIVPRDTLSPDWRRERHLLAAARYLAVTRDTVSERLRQLNGQQRADMFTTDWWTDHPKEPWTARKVLRRMLEHEREHIHHTGEVLADMRAHLLARMAAERAALLWQYIGFDEATLTTGHVFADWTPKDLLAHIAAWDAFQTERMALLMAGRTAEIQSVDVDARNAGLHAMHRDWPLEQSLAAFLKERSGFRATLKRISDTELHRRRRFHRGWRSTMYTWARWRWQHDATHMRDLQQWRKRNNLTRNVGPKSLLRAAFRAARKELLTVAALVPEHERETRAVCGVWTLKDVLGHIADWELYVVRVLPQLRAEGTHPLGDAADIQTWNTTAAAARQHQPWDEVWADYEGARSMLTAALDDMAQDELARPVMDGWDNKEVSLYRWLLIWLVHERGHAIDVRRALQLPATPARLLSFDSIHK